ncbi:MAG: hypothetical protein ABIR36_01580 [Nitrospiraceae bacterium]
MDSASLVWLVPLGQTPDYLDLQSQEALHEVDVSGVAPHFSFRQYQSETPSEAWEEGAGSEGWVTEQGAGHDTD